MLDVGCPSVCCEYVLLLFVLNKAAVAYDREDIARQEIQTEIMKERG